MTKKRAKPKGKAKKDGERALDLLLEDLLPSIDRHATFVDSVPLEVADSYRRLKAGKRLAPVFKKLKKHGLKVRDIKILRRRIALLPLEWERENESWNIRQKRRAAMAKKLRKLATEAAADPDLKGLRIGVETIALNCSPDEQDDLHTFAEVMNIGASILEPSDLPLTMTEDGKLLTPEQSDQLYSPERRISEQTYVLLRIFGMLEPYFEPADDPLPPRAPNKIVETLGSVLLQKKIKSGTVSKLRPDDHRKYTLDPK
ncbi:MAG: hypothetical protein IID51_00800 [Proteobacteria bacterium]|nr:hypothetical protein [Pseudomonadota bacterium]